MMLKTTRDTIIADLLRARPRGPVGRRVTYTTSEEYDYNKSKYVNIPVPSDPQWGYSDEEIYSLDLRSKDDVEKYVRDRWFEGKGAWSLGRQKATLTRRVNKLWNDRLEDIVTRVSRKGGAGIYSVRKGYYRSDGEFGHIYAATKEEAQRFAEMFFGYLIPEGNPRIDFVRFGTPKEVVVLNAQTIQRAAENIAKYQKKIEEMEHAISQQKMWLDTLNTVEQQQLAAEV
jgi:hypothetical protein